MVETGVVQSYRVALGTMVKLGDFGPLSLIYESSADFECSYMSVAEGTILWVVACP